MDCLLRGNSLSFSIDEILYDAEKNIFPVRIIPEINSPYFLPFHLRLINVRPELVSENFLQKYSHYGFEINSIDDFRSNSVIQGGYYQIDRTSVPSDIWNNLFKEDTIIERDNDIFAKTNKESPYIEAKIFPKNDILKISDENILNSNNPDVLKSLFLYCFNVGQGDSFLLITPNGSSYLIDTNIYRLDYFVNNIQQILRQHSLDDKHIKGLIITHKHLDHLRGASQLLDSQKLKFENFLINMDYEHPTKAVSDLYNSVKKNIPNWFNVNGKGSIVEGNTKIYINNPDKDTLNSQVAPDINDSSICLYVSYGNTMMYLTGDASYSVILDKFAQHANSNKESILKVSHHGSLTGTNYGVLKLTNPYYAFISAGYNKRFNHPDKEILTLLQNHPICQMTVSKYEKRTVSYESTGCKIIKR